MAIWIKAASVRNSIHSFLKTLTLRNTSRTFYSTLLSTMSAAPYLLTPSEVKSKLSPSTDKAVPVDVSWFMPGSERKPAEEFKTKHLPGARYLNLDEVADKSHELNLKHMMPSPETFAQACSEFGISPDTHVILYDTQGVFSAPRALFMFRSFGHSNSSVLNGGLPLWEEEGLPIEEGSAAVQPVSYPTPTYDPSIVKSYQDIVANAELNPAEQSMAYLVIDARPRQRFTGEAPEPRPGMSSGHMPHAFSVPFNTFLQPNTTASGVKYNTFLPPAKVHEALVGAIGEQNVRDVLSGKRSITSSCGSGMTAGILWLGLKLIGVEKPSLYDESWMGYASRKESKIVKGI